MVTITITKRHVLTACGVIIWFFMFCFSGIVGILSIGGMTLLTDLSSDDKTIFKHDINAMNSTAKVQFSQTEKSFVNLLASLYWIWFFILPFFFTGLILYIGLFTKFDDKDVRKSLRTIFIWCLRHVKDNNKQPIRKD